MKPKPSLIFFLVFSISFVLPVQGFLLRGCKISYNIAICEKSKLRTVPRDIPPTVTGFDLSVNHLSRIQPSDFPHFPLLLRLDLNYNNISQVDSRAFANLTSLQKLNLNNNKVARLQENVFKGLNNLSELRISNNRIKHVAATSFESLTSLKFLDISHNKLQKVSNVHLILQHLPRLQELVVKANDLKTFDSRELTNSSLELCVLDLSKNPLKEFRVSADVFPNLTRFYIGSSSSNKPMMWDVRNTTFLRQVSRLDISELQMSLKDMKSLFEGVNSSLTALKMNAMKHNLSAIVNMSCTVPTMSTLQFRRNNLKFLSPIFFKLCVNVTELDIAENRIGSISDNAFTSLDSLRVLCLSRNKLSWVPPAARSIRSLSKLDLSTNNISRLECHDFANMTRLTELSLYQNSISALRECFFKDLVRLQVLRLQNNKITKLDLTFKRILPNLKRLHLNGNKLTTIQNLEFRGLQSLLNLSLHFNEIKSLHKESFDGLTSLTDIQLQNNAITMKDVNTGAFNALTNLRRLDLSENRIKYDKSEKLPHPPFSKLSHLEELSIPGQHYRGMSNLPMNFLQGLTNLSLFRVRNIHLQSLHKDTFKYTPKLERLDISANELELPNPQLFSPIPNLKSLYISRTTFQSLDFLKYANLTALEFLQARKNQYSVITEDVMRALPALTFLDFQGNSFTCDCDNAWFLNWVETDKQTQVYDGYNFECNYPEDFKGQKLLSFDPKSCSVDIGFIWFISTTCSTICFMLVCFTYHFMRWQLVYAYYLFVAWLFDTKHRNKQAPNRYDAFISYNNQDEQWVIDELLPKLEGEQGWKLCLHHRDFEPGRSILDNITDAIYGSRKTICVISDRYLESEWCSREIQAASFRLFDEQKDVLILVFLEEIPSYRLAPYHRMRKILKKKTYLSWPKTREHPEVFWEKLRQALKSTDVMEDNGILLNVQEIQ
ncbi:toll-like receptor 22 [Cololabis saira]|uniref:toll-like receptor 22 n=1 Tax=Cololabis saira TaxID=129043 RepID=UPI002AD3FA9C|nr:toll-like receptor 22 [Cololabis saira]